MQAYRPSTMLAYWHWAVALQILWWQYLCAILQALFEGLGLLMRRKKRAPPVQDNVVDPLQRQASFRAGQKVVNGARAAHRSTCISECAHHGRLCMILKFMHAESSGGCFGSCAWRRRRRGCSTCRKKKTLLTKWCPAGGIS